MLSWFFLMFYSFMAMMLYFLYMLTNFQIMVFYFIMMIMSLGFMSEILEYAYLNSYWFLDNLSVLLSFMTLIIMFMINLNLYKMKKFIYNILVLLMLMSLVYCFNMDNFLFMYINFEVSLVPLLVFIYLRGMNIERIKANMSLLIFTLIGSFIFILIMLKMNMNLSMFCMLMSKPLLKEGVIWMMILIIFFIKMPLYCFHVWLPKAHVEASVEGSMVLAGVLLKLGSYGYIRMMYFIKYNKVFICMFYSISLLGGLVGSLICFRQLDLKSMVAYSSISHMSFMMSSMLSNNLLSLASLGLMLGHGFCSSNLFFISNLFYMKFKSRNMLVLKGLSENFFLLNMFWLLTCVINMGVPPFLNFFSELMLVYSLMKFNGGFSLVIIVGVLLLNVIYGLNIYTRMGCGVGNLNLKNYSFSMLNYLMIMFHIYFLLIYLYIIKYIFML